MGGEKSKNKSFVLRMDASTMEAVEKWAADEFRSVNGQLQWIVTEALRKNRRLPSSRAKHPQRGDDALEGASGAEPRKEKPV